MLFRNSFLERILQGERALLTGDLAELKERESSRERGLSLWLQG